LPEAPTEPTGSAAHHQTLPAPTHWSLAQPWQTNAALLFLGLCLFLLSRHLIFEYDDYTIGFSGTSGWSVWCYALGSLLVLFGPTDRFTFPIILSVAIACRLATLFADPFLSSDIYRYVWDGIVQHAGINPYRYVPADPHLAFLRDASDADIYPMINRKEYARTIYPPLAQILFWITTFISPTVICMKTVMVLFEGLTLWTILKLLHLLGRPREQAILYAWCPMLIWEIAGSGHLDSAAMAFIGLALLARYHRRPALTGLFLGVAVLIKFYPLVLFPALYLRSPTVDEAGNRRTFLQTLDWRMPAAMLALALPAYALYSSVGKLVFGFLGGYVQEEGMATGTRYFLLEQAQHLPGLHNLPPNAYLAFAALVLATLSLWALRTSSPVFNPVLQGPSSRPEAQPRQAGAPSMAAPSPWVGSSGEPRGQPPPAPDGVTAHPQSPFLPPGAPFMAAPSPWLGSSAEPRGQPPPAPDGVIAQPQSPFLPPGAPSMAAPSPWVGSSADLLSPVTAPGAPSSPAASSPETGVPASFAGGVQRVGSSSGEARSQAAAFLTPAFALAAALMLLFSPHYPWYIAWLVPFLTLLPNLPIAAYTLGLFYLCTTSLAVGSGPKQFLLNQILYSAIAFATLLQLALRRWPPNAIAHRSSLKAQS